MGINWENTMQGKCKRGAFTWDLIAEDWCPLDNGGPRVVPKSKRTKQSVEEEQGTAEQSRVRQGKVRQGKVRPGKAR